MPPANGTTCPSPSSSPTTTFLFFGAGNRSTSRPRKSFGSWSGWVPERTYCASSACTSTGRPVFSDTYAAPPAWSGWQCVSINLVTSLAPEPIDSSAAITFLPEDATPMSIRVTCPSSSRSMKPLT